MKHNRMVVLGAGESGTGAAILAKKIGYEVFVSDTGTIREKYRNVLLHADIAFEEGRHTSRSILNASEVVKSPGIPDNAGIVEHLVRKRVPVISEIEFAARHTNARLTCITGSNGKTTTTLLTHHMFKKAGLNAGLAGNVGHSFALQVAEKDFDHYVLEISSFQLDGMFRFRARTAVLLNITPDHLDRYENRMERYVDSKFRITRNMEDEDDFIYCLDDPVIIRGIRDRRVVARHLPFSLRSRLLGEGACLEENKIMININSNPMHMTLEALALQGKHNIYNSMAAAIAARVVDIRKETIQECLSDFQNIEHRLERVANIHGIEFVNDSKATNVNSAWYALESMNRTVVWIVGGQDKGNDYSLLHDLVASKVRAIVCLGLDNHRIIEAFYGKVPVMTEATSMEEAVAQAYAAAKDGDTVLLSPCCASFDLFENYEERGQKFKEEVKKL